MQRWTLSRIFSKEWIRIYLLTLVSLLAILTLGASAPLSNEASESILERVKGILPEEVTTEAIFLNNMRVALLMTVPIIGLLQGGAIVYSTGLVFGATGESLGVFGPVLILLVALTPFFWLEFLAYSAGITQGIFMIRGLVSKELREEAVRTIVILPLMAVSLLLGALVEVLYTQ